MGSAFSGAADFLNQASLSHELYVIPHDGEQILYAPLELSALLVNSSAVRAIQSFQRGNASLLADSPELIEALCGARMLTLTTSKGRPAPVTASNDFNVRGLTLSLTSNCNMYCVYCHANGGAQSANMPFEVAETALLAVLELIASRGRSSAHLVFHGGGEVTAAAEMMKRCTELGRREASRLGLKLHVGAGLNGVMDTDLAEWVATHFDSATVSLDGIESVQNAQRPLMGGGTSFHRVASTLETFDRLGFKYGIRSTVTARGVQRLADGVELICKRFGASIIRAEPVFPAGRAASTPVEHLSPEIFVREFRRARRVALQHGRTLEYSGARLSSLSPVFCLATGGSMVVLPDGKVTACYEVVEPNDARMNLFTIGQVVPETRTLKLREDQLSRLRTLTVQHKPHCQQCFCRWHCAGDCPAKLASYGDAWDPSQSDRCWINRELTADQIIEKLVIPPNAIADQAQAI
jgi:uncharacterized protein